MTWESAATNSCVGSRAVDVHVNRLGIGAIRSGCPADHSLLQDGCRRRLCFVAFRRAAGRPIEHDVELARGNLSMRRFDEIVGDRLRCLRRVPRQSASLIAGYAASSSARSDSAHGNASSYLRSDIGPTPPSTWHRPQRFRKIG